MHRILYPKNFNTFDDFDIVLKSKFDKWLIKFFHELSIIDNELYINEFG